jgi:plasmid stabilization system protein ParE
VIPLSSEAEAQLDDLMTHYERLERIEAVRNLLAAVEAAAARIERAPEAGLSAPRPYPNLARLGLRWIKESAYWIAYMDAARGPNHRRDLPRHSRHPESHLSTGLFTPDL